MSVRTSSPLFLEGKPGPPRPSSLQSERFGPDWPQGSQHHPHFTFCTLALLTSPVPLTVFPVGSSSDEDIQYRVVTRFVNEAVIFLQEGILATPVREIPGQSLALASPLSWTALPFCGSTRCPKDSGLAPAVQAAYGKQFPPCQLLTDHANRPSKKFCQ